MNIKSFFLIALFSFISGNAYSWTRSAGFEDGTIGELAIGSDALSSNAAQATYDDTHVFSGDQSLKAQVWAGGTAFGGAIAYPSTLGEGDEVWYRARWYIPADWIFTTESDQKTMRISGAGGGAWWDIYLDSVTHRVVPHTDANAKVPFNTFVYTDSPLRTASGGNHGEPARIDDWNTFEIYLKLSATAANSIIRIWQDGNLIFDCDGVVPTLNTASNVSDRVLIGNFYNGAGPQTQSLWVDNVVITSDTPSNTDSEGNPYIGAGETPPSGPTYLRLRFN